MFDKIKLLKSFIKPDEKLLFSKVLDQVFVCCEKHYSTFSAFLDPYKLKVFSDIIEQNIDIEVKQFGGAEGCERQMLGFYKDYTNLEESEFPIDVLEIEFSKTAGKKLNHKDFLGSILGTGIDRGKVGDIFIFESRAVTFISNDISAHVSGNLKSIGRVSVDSSIIKDDFLLAPLKDFLEKEISVTSLRLDAVISSAFNISRSESLKLIQSEKAQINWAKVKNATYIVSIADIITLRGYGRITIKEIHGTKKGNFIITVDLL